MTWVLQVKCKDKVFRFDAELLLVLAAERMEEYRCRAPEFLDGQYSDDCQAVVFAYFMETQSITSDVDLEVMDECARVVKQDPRFRRAVEQLQIDDSEWRGGFYPELHDLLASDFARHFPQYHNLFLRGLLDHEFKVWCVDRLLDAGLPGSLHRFPYREQRRLAHAAGIACKDPSEEMIDFYVAKVEAAKELIDMDGNQRIRY